MKKNMTRVFAAVLAVMMLALPAFAEQFTPSVEQKGAPGISAVTDSKGEQVAAVINEKDGKEVAGVPVADLVVTPMAEASKAAPEVKEMLENAFKQISEAKSLAELSPEIADVLAQVKSDAKVEDLVVRDLVDVSLSEEMMAVLKESGNSITLTFQLGLKEGETLLVLHNFEGDKWETIPADKVVRQDNGDVTVTFDSLSPVAFVVNAKEYGAAGQTQTTEPTETTPATEATDAAEVTEAPEVTEVPEATEAPAAQGGSNTGMIVAIVVVAAVVVVLLLVSKKNKKKESVAK